GKVYAVIDTFIKRAGHPTVTLAPTNMGWVPDAVMRRNATHQMSKLTNDDLAGVRDRLTAPVSDAHVDAHDRAPFFHRGAARDEIQYMLARRAALGGGMPHRVVEPVAVKLPEPTMYDELKTGSGKQQVATTMAFVRLLRDLMRDPEVGPRLVPIAPDEYRTFG